MLIDSTRHNDGKFFLEDKSVVYDIHLEVNNQRGRNGHLLIPFRPTTEPIKNLTDQLWNSRQHIKGEIYDY